MPGKLLVISTPIGNLEDLSPRAHGALQLADLIACEDTRRTGRLISGLGFRRALLSLNDHNERRRIPRIMAELEEGKVVALVSDAGTPVLSDPGFPLIREAISRNIAVEAIPGPSALLTALVISGLPPLPFTFAGFPPRKSGRRRTFYEKLAPLSHTLIFYESPHRLLASLGDAAEILGDRPAAIGRELTKMYEEILRGRLSELKTELETRPTLKGEFVLVVGPSRGSGVSERS